jgi:hypothetical protein
LGLHRRFAALHRLRAADRPDFGDSAALAQKRSPGSQPAYLWDWKACRESVRAFLHDQDSAPSYANARYWYAKIKKRAPIASGSTAAGRRRGEPGCASPADDLRMRRSIRSARFARRIWLTRA